MSSKLTLDVFKRVLPKGSLATVDQKVIDGINKTFSEPDEMQMYRDNLIGYAHLLKNGKFKLTQYIDAVR